MDDLMKCLYEFVNENRMGSVFNDPEYKEVTHSVKLQTERVRKGMTHQQKRDLNLLLEDVVSQCAIENEYLFQAALGLAKELNGLTT